MALPMSRKLIKSVVGYCLEASNRCKSKSQRNSKWETLRDGNSHDSESNNKDAQEQWTLFCCISRTVR